MRKLGFVWVAIAILSASSILANNPIGDTPVEAMKAQVKELLSSYQADLDQRNSVTATIRFMVNRENEFVVLSVDTKDKYLGHFIKSKLNYRKVNAQGISRGRKYIIPLKVVI
ncbi:MAG: hypothetical protein AAFX53_15055 [Bacteroidota bacterium]